MVKRRRTYGSSFKAKVALEAMQEELTLSQLSSKYGVSGNMIAKWKKHFKENLGAVFESDGKNKSEDEEISRDDLLKEIGQLKVENDYLKKKYRQLYG